MTSSESESTVPSRKRSRASANSEESGNKKARGRPRVDTQDATAADRRRTQIRLAQRAYRQRKETTISSLKKQNTQLQSIIEQMNKSFLRFNDYVSQSGLVQGDSVLTRELKQVNDSFTTLVKTAAAEGSHEADDEGVDPPAADTEETTPQLPVPHPTIVGWPPSDNPINTTQANASGKPGAGSLFFHSPESDSSYEMAQTDLVRARPRGPTIGELWDQSRPRVDISDTQPLPFGLVDLIDHDLYQTNSQMFTVNIPTPDLTPPSTRLPTPPPSRSVIPRHVSQPWTYSHDETTFARRLTRASVEMGFHLLSTASLRPGALNRVFRMSLPYYTLDELRERFKELLARGTDEELDCAGTPFVHLGGAGTHYPRKDRNGNYAPLPSTWNIRSIGPLPTKKIRAENTADPSQSHDLDIDFTGFEGEWFDAHDVQGYLEEEKGCFIDPTDSFAQVFVEVDDETNFTGFTNAPFSKDMHMGMDMELSDPRTPPLSRSDSSSLGNGRNATQSTSRNIESMFMSGETFGLDMGFANHNSMGKSNIDVTNMYNQPLGLDMASFGDMSNLGLDMGAGMGIPLVKQKLKKAAWVDVAKLVEEILKKGVCLGRAPGFRRKDVDLAFQASLISSF